VKADTDLITKLNQPVPYYTSYPTVPFWKEQIDVAGWKQQFREQFIKSNGSGGISLYIHLPFCESLCIYCGCNKKITTNHTVEEEYLQAIFKEWSMYLEMMERPPVIREIHLGGGTPTFFSPGNLERLVSGLLEKAVVGADHSFSVEGHPNNTTREHLDVLYGLGFRRISFGVQDLDPDVQRAIHRLQPFENLRRATENARSAGFTSINFDLIYGLPLQNVNTLTRTIWQCLILDPDRIAFYSYGHAPSLNCAQRLIDEDSLPDADMKMALYVRGKELLTGAGYANIGMDHFALPKDELYTAWKGGTLHRNFMGYTTRASGMLLGLGVSSISETGTALVQNDKTLAGYYRSVAGGELAVRKGYFLNEEDQVFRGHILDITCRGYALFSPVCSPELLEWTLPELRALERDGLVRLDEKGVYVTEAGWPYLRYVCRAFDLHLLRAEKRVVVP
jgi:oxygen-independent coproporphyrinogen-3 oxidase